MPQEFSLPVPFLFDAPAGAAESGPLYQALAHAAARIQSLAIIPLRRLLALGVKGAAVAPLVAPEEVETLGRLPAPPQMMELDGWDESAYAWARRRFPKTAVFARLPFERDLLPLIRIGVRLFHLTADYHGRCGGTFISDAIRAAHAALVKAGLREETVLIGSGGIITAADVPKAIICGLDAVALDTAVLVALQARFEGECVDRVSATIRLPDFECGWAAQRLMNLAAAWRDQLLEILGAMGLREVRRLRGEQGRALFQAELEREAFAGIAGFEA